MQQMNLSISTLKRMAIVLGTGSFSLTTTVATAQGLTVFQGLPPLPPNIPSLEAIPKDEVRMEEVIPVPTRQMPPIQEFNFEAPRPTLPTFSPNLAPTTVPTLQPAVIAPAATPASRQYRVEVVSRDPAILATVKKVQPEAFIRGDRIQAGSFSQAANAQTLQANLRAKGIVANIVEVSLSPSRPAIGSSTEEGGYFVAIPASPSAFRQIATQVQSLGVSAGLIQQRSAPRGNHIAVGPFSSRQEAELMNSRIRSADLDGRLYFHN